MMICSGRSCRELVGGKICTLCKGASSKMQIIIRQIVSNELLDDLSNYDLSNFKTKLNRDKAKTQQNKTEVDPSRYR